MTHQDTTATEGFKENLDINMDYLSKHLINLTSENDQDFARSLIAGWKRFGTLTDRQLPYAAKLWARALDAESGTGRKVTAEEQLHESINCKKIADMLSAASKRIQEPKLRFYLGDGSHILMRISRYKAAHVAFILVPANGSGVTYLGNGNMTSGACYFNDKVTPQELMIIKSICEEPKEVLIANGRAVVRCCFCSIALSTNESRYTGYGPICAEKWGLPWGDEFKKSKEEEGLFDIT